MNFGKLAMLHRLAGGTPITIYTSENQEDLKKLHDYLQELCNDSKDLQCTDHAIVSANPFLAFHLKEVVKNQRLVPSDPS